MKSETGSSCKVVVVVVVVKNFNCPIEDFQYLTKNWIENRHKFRSDHKCKQKWNEKKK